jgi:hypothetical protein
LCCIAAASQLPNSNIIRETFEAVSNWLGSLAGPYLYIELPRKQENGRKTRRQISSSSTQHKVLLKSSCFAIREAALRARNRL